MDEEIIVLEEEIEIIEEIEMEEISSVDSDSGARHNTLVDRNDTGSHEICAINGLRAELDKIETPRVIESNMPQQADYYAWEGSAPTSPIGIFVSLKNGKITTCSDTMDVFGVTVECAGFVGNQDYTTPSNGTKIGRGDGYNLVAHSGVVAVQKYTDVTVGDYVVPDASGIAKKSDGKYGYLVTGLSELYGVPCAVISLSAPSTIAKQVSDTLYDEATGLVTWAESAESRIISVGNKADEAYALAQQGGSSNGALGEKVDGVIDRVDQVEETVGGIQNSVTNIHTISIEAKAMADGAVSMAHQISDTANITSKDLNALITELKPITEWVDPNNDANKGAQYYTAHIQNGLNTKVDIETFETATEEGMTAIMRNGAQIESIAQKIDKYSVGEYSQAYNLTWEQAKSILRDGMIHIPTKTHEETYEDENGDYTQKFTKEYYYTWDGETWAPSDRVAVSFSSNYVYGTEGSYWVVTVNSVAKLSDATAPCIEVETWNDGNKNADNIYYAEDTKLYWYNKNQTWASTQKGRTYDFGGLYLFTAHGAIELESWKEDGKYIDKIYYAKDTKLYWYYDGGWKSTNNNSIDNYWEKVALVADNTLSRVFSSIDQKANEISANVSNVKGDVAALDLRVDGAETSISTITTWQGNTNNKITAIEQKTNDNEASIALVVAEKDGDKVVNAASIVTAINEDGDSEIKLNADHIKFTANADYSVLSDHITLKASKLDFGGEGTDQIKINATNIDFEGVTNLNIDSSNINLSGDGFSVNADNIVFTSKAFEIYPSDGAGNVSSNESNFSVDEYGNVNIKGSIYTDDGTIQTKDYNIISSWDMSHLKLTYELSDDESYYIVSGNNDVKELDIITIPETYGEKHVKKIKDNAFQDFKSLKEIIIPDTIETIGTRAFDGCEKLQDVTIPENIKYVYQYSFRGCKSLRSIIVPNGYIGSGAFEKCTNLVNVKFSAGRPDLQYTFKDCTSLTHVEIPDDVKKLDLTFNNCTNLKSVILPSSLNEIINNAFVGCDSLSDIYFKGTPEQWELISKDSSGILDTVSVHYYSESVPNNENYKYWSYNEDGFKISCDYDMIDSKYFKVTSDGKITASEVNLSGTINANSGNIGGLTITDNSIQTSNYQKNNMVVVWGKNVSEGLKYELSEDNTSYVITGIGTCTDTDIIIPSEIDGKIVKSIKYLAFKDNKSIINVEIPDSVEDIGHSAFMNCTLLSRVKLPSNITLIHESVFSGCDSLISIEIPDSVTCIDKYAFYSCNSLASVTIGNGVTNINGRAFFNCSMLSDIKIPDSVTSIGDYAFTGCSSLTSIEIPDGVTSIGNSVFAECSSLTEIVIPDSVTSIDVYAFFGCNNLTSVYYKGTNNQWQDINIIEYNHDNDAIKNATIYYYSNTTPTAEGNYWHYSDEIGFKIASSDNMINSKNFNVTSDGIVTASNVDLTGIINADAGKIGDLIIDRGIKAYDDNKQLFELTKDGLKIDKSSSFIKFGDVNMYYNESESKTYMDTNGALCIRASKGSDDVDGYDTSIEFFGANEGDDYVVNIDLKIMVKNIEDDSENKPTQRHYYYPVVLQIFCDKEARREITQTIYTNNKYIAMSNGSQDQSGENGTIYSMKFTIKPGETKSNEVILYYGCTDDIPSLENCRIRLSFDYNNHGDFNYSFAEFFLGAAHTTEVFYSTNLKKNITQYNYIPGVFITGNLIPKTTDTLSAYTSYTLGTENNFWDTVYAKNGNINTSDRNEKNTINKLSDKYGQFFDLLEPSSYKFNVNSSDRTHVGFIAQDVKLALEKSNLTTQEFAGYCEWEKKDGTIGCGLRYDEFIALCVDQIQKLKKRVEDLQNKLETQQND